MVKKPAVSKTKEKAQRKAEERQNAIKAQFDKHYLKEWGDKRWPGLPEALEKPVRHWIALKKSHPNQKVYSHRLTSPCSRGSPSLAFQRHNRRSPSRRPMVLIFQW